MATENNISPDDLLEKVQRVEAPPFMMTRIQARINTIQSEVVKPVFAWSLLGLVAIILLVNLLALKQYRNSQDQEDLVQMMDLAPQNNLYNN